MPSVFILPSFGVVYGFDFHVAHGDLWWMQGAFRGIGMAATAGITRRHAPDARTMGPSGPWRCITCSGTVIAAALTFVASSGRALGYRPFVSTDAAVADTGDVEIEFGYIGFRADHAGATILAPEVVISLGVVRDLEAVVQSTLANDVTRRRGVPSSRFEDTEV